MTITELIEMLSDPMIMAFGQGYILNEKIATFLWGEPQLSGSAGQPKTLHWWNKGVGYAVPPDFTGSLDNAIKLYTIIPETIPSKPIMVCREALLQSEILSRLDIHH